MIPEHVAKVVLAGSMANGEIFNCGFWVNFASDQPDAASFASFIAGVETSLSDTTAGVSFQNAFEELNTAETQLTDIFGYYYGDESGHATLQADHTLGSPWVGTSSGSHPLQVALVATLLTGAPGRSRRGRLYCPATGATLNIDGQVNATQVDHLSAGLAHGFTHLHSHSDPTGIPSVVSSTLSTSNPITTVRVDSRADIQRRRANRQLAEYSHSTTV